MSKAFVGVRFYRLTAEEAEKARPGDTLPVLTFISQEDDGTNKGHGMFLKRVEGGWRFLATEAGEGRVVFPDFESAYVTLLTRAMQLTLNATFLIGGHNMVIASMSADEVQQAQPRGPVAPGAELVA